MANHASAEKSIRQTKERTARNRVRMSATRTAVKKLENAITAKEKDKAEGLLKEVSSVLMRSAQRGLLHKNAASRKLSRLVARIRTLA